MSLERTLSLALALLGLGWSGCSKPDAGLAATATTKAQNAQPPVTSPAVSPKHTNRLAQEKSPYLLQHAHNPVDWFPWGEEAFAKARAEQKPIFLSIGYSTCHWCHVMERESFEDEPTAALLNAQFVCIKVDREERPDVDKIYMTAVQAMTGEGGWPLNVFLTPELKPFFGGTYWPPQPRFGRASFRQVLESVRRAWDTRRAEVVHSAQELHQHLANLNAAESTNLLVLSPAVLQQAGRAFKQEFDPRYGGFGSAPKFPRPSQPAFLLRYARRFGDPEAAEMVLRTCDRMAAGGIYDQLGGGFARYSVDEKWLVPHFEKMLYDNAQLVQLYLDAYLVSGQGRYADVVRDILRYVLRDLTHPDGGFYSAEDADSEGKEGKFYCWTREEIKSLLSAEEFSVAVRYFGVTDAGNFVDHSDPDPLPGQNVLHIADPKLTAEESVRLGAAKQKLFAARSKRVRPHLDDKVLSSWNGMMLGAVARASAVLGDTAYRQAAEKNLAFLQAKLWDAPSRTLYHRWRDGQRDSVQLLDAYAHLLAGVIDLYEATLETRHLEFALALAETMLAKFFDAEAGGFWQSPGDAGDLILRVKDDYDGAEPSGNSVAALALLKLGAITDRQDFREAAGKTLRYFADRLHRLPQAVPHLLCALDFWIDEPKRVVIAGDPASARVRELVSAAHGVYLPNKVVLGNRGPVEPFARTLPDGDGGLAYVCTGTACQPPTAEAAGVKTYLEARP